MSMKHDSAFSLGQIHGSLDLSPPTGFWVAVDSIDRLRLGGWDLGRLGARERVVEALARRCRRSQAQRAQLPAWYMDDLGSADRLPGNAARATVAGEGMYCCG